jgi:hypothetical protein
MTNGGRAPFKTLRHPKPIDEFPRLVVLRKDVVVVRLDRLATDRDRAGEAADGGRRLDEDDPPAGLETPFCRSEPGHAAAEHDGIDACLGHPRVISIGGAYLHLNGLRREGDSPNGLGRKSRTGYAHSPALDPPAVGGASRAQTSFRSAVYWP